MIGLDDCGSTVFLPYSSIGGDYKANTKIQMVIRAPRGTMAVFDQQYISPDSQCEAIRAFMEEHRND